MRDEKITKLLNEIGEERESHMRKWSREHDKIHTEGELGLAAACLAAPRQLYENDNSGVGYLFRDPWPWVNGTTATKKGYMTRRRQLLCSAALILAELERIGEDQELP